ncbi:hypothetical protein [Streptomyces achromogenes]|uniref:hypothetical protein n=1 Tax=Streptomyces achromogenes TaxID=67255 RepID=UPI003A8134B6
MTGPEFAAAHGDSTTWSSADFETEINLAEIDQLPHECWFCSAPNPPTATTCSFCCHRADDNPNHPIAA